MKEIPIVPFATIVSLLGVMIFSVSKLLSFLAALGVLASLLVLIKSIKE